MKHKLLLGIILATQMLYGYEEAYLQLKSKGAVNDFYRVYYDEPKNEIYMGVESYLNFLRMSNLKFDRQKMRITGILDDGRNFNKSVDVPGKIVDNEDVYIPLKDMKNIFEAKNVIWNNNEFSLVFDPGFKTPGEMESESYENRLALEAQKNELNGLDKEEVNSRYFSPGVFKLNYTNYDLSESENYSFSLEYGTQLLKGDFQIGYQVAPESTLDYVTLEYKDFYKDMDLVFGDAVLETEGLYDVETSIRGVSISRDGAFGYIMEDRVIIEGQAINANLIELYRDGVLQEFIRPRGNNFRFETPSFTGLNNYTLRIYYRDGRVEVRKINLLGDTTVLGKGASDYIFQIGQGVEDKKLQGVARVKYGVTNNLTLGVGASRFEGVIEEDDQVIEETNSEDKDPIYEVLEGQLAYRLPISFLPTIVGGTIFRENNYGENSYRLNILSELWSTNLYFKYEKLGEKAAENREVDSYYDAGISRTFGWLTLSAGNLHEKYSKYENSIRNSRNTAYIDLNIARIPNTNISIYNRYVEDYDGSKELEVTGRVLYSGFDSFYTILSATQKNKKGDYQVAKDRQNEYAISITRNVNNDSIFKNLDITAEARYNDEDKWVFEIDFTYYLDGWVYIETPLNMTKDKTTIGLEVEKAFYVGNPLKKMNNTTVKDSWIEGEVFIDSNGNGKRDPGEKVMPDVEISAGGETGKTDKNGRYIVGSLSPDTEHKVDINKESIDATLNPTKDNFIYKGKASIGKKIDIPVAPYSMISGNIVNKNMSNTQFYNTLLGTKVLLKKNEKVVQTATLETDGYYHFIDILPGDYDIELSVVSQRETTKDKNIIPIKVKGGEEGEFYEGNDFILGTK